jgi:hypothetical protein
MKAVSAMLLLGLFAPVAAYAGNGATAEMSIAIGGSFGRVVVRPKVKPASAFKDQNVVKQTLDYSCGAAATATIFNYYLGESVTEERVIDSMFKAGDVNKIIARKGFSLLDIKKFAEFMGYRAVGYRTDMQGLVSLDKPSIVAIILRGYKHFVVFKGIENGRVFLADSALGNTTVSLREFEQMWYRQIALVIEPRNDQARDGLKIRKEERIMVSSSDLRRSIFYNSILFSKTANEF